MKTSILILALAILSFTASAQQGQRKNNQSTGIPQTVQPDSIKLKKQEELKAAVGILERAFLLIDSSDIPSRDRKQTLKEFEALAAYLKQKIESVPIVKEK